MNTFQCNYYLQINRKYDDIIASNCSSSWSLSFSSMLADFHLIKPLSSWINTIDGQAHLIQILTRLNPISLHGDRSRANNSTTKFFSFRAKIFSFFVLMTFCQQTLFSSHNILHSNHNLVRSSLQCGLQMLLSHATADCLGKISTILLISAR